MTLAGIEIDKDVVRHVLAKAKKGRGCPVWRHLGKHA